MSSLITNFPHMFKLIIGWISNLSLWFKLLLGSLLGALGGSTFVGFINIYAVYNYAYHFGARIPVEGVPYLNFAVSVVSFAFLFVSLICATLVYGGLLLIAHTLGGLCEAVVATWKNSDTRKKLEILPFFYLS